MAAEKVAEQFLVAQFGWIEDDLPGGDRAGPSVQLQDGELGVAASERENDAVTGHNPLDDGRGLRERLAVGLPSALEGGRELVEVRPGLRRTGSLGEGHSTLPTNSAAAARV